MNMRYGWLILLAALGASTAGCSGSAGEYCDLKCDCEGCNDQEYDECIVHTEAAQDRGSAYDCDEEVDVLMECILNDNDCDEIAGVEIFTADCGDEQDDVNDCLSDGTDLDIDLGG